MNILVYFRVFIMSLVVVGFCVELGVMMWWKVF